MKDLADLLGRLFIGIYFMYEALDSMLFFNNNLNTLIEYGITWWPKGVLFSSMVLLAIASFMVIIGYYANVGAIVLICYWVPFTIIVHSFWNDGPELQRLTSLNFMLNMAMCGGLMILFANGSRRFSVKRIIHVMRLPQ